MHDDDNPRRLLLNDEEDDRTEAAVLGLLLQEHPTQLTIVELTLKLAGGSPAFGGTDGVARAVRDLAGAGLLHRDGDTIRPTFAALRFHELIDR